MKFLERHILKLESLIAVILLAAILWPQFYQAQLSLMFLDFTLDSNYGWVGPVSNLLVYLFFTSVLFFGLYLKHKETKQKVIHLLFGMSIVINLYGFMSAYVQGLGV